MIELMMMLAKIMPEEMILEKIEESLREYRLLKTNHSKQVFMMYINLFMSKQAGNAEGFAETIKELRDMKTLHETFSKNKQ